MTREQLMEMGLDAAAAERVLEAVEAEMRGLIQEREALMKEHAVEVQLLRAGARCVPAVKALLDMDAVKLNEKGEPEGLQEQIDALKANEETAFLFREAQGDARFVGVKLGEGMDLDCGPEPARMSYDELCAYLEKNPGVKL